MNFDLTPEAPRRKHGKAPRRIQTPKVRKNRPAPLAHEHTWRQSLMDTGKGYYTLGTSDIGDVPVRLFLTPELMDGVENNIYSQIVNATRFPGVKLVVLTPDCHFGYGVPVGCVILTEADGAIAMGPVGFDIGCFTYDTLVPTLDGQAYPIGELAEKGEPVYVYAMDENQKIQVSLATPKKTRQNASLVRVTLDNGKTIDCTPDHLFMLRDGSYKEAAQLKPQTALMPFKGDNHKVLSVAPLDYTEDVYCLTVPELHNFALEAGVFVHNCGMASAQSQIPAEAATDSRKLAFNQAVLDRIGMGAGEGSKLKIGNVDRREFQKLVRGGASYYMGKYGDRLDRSKAERNRLDVDDTWDIPWGGKGRPERGVPQLGSLGGGNHFVELQRSEQTGTLFVQIHTGSRGFGHGMAENYFQLAKEENPSITALDLGYFEPNSHHYREYLNAVAAGANFAMINRMIIAEQVAVAFKEVFGGELELIYEISHNLVQREWHPEFGEVNVHRKGATRALPAGHPGIAGTVWEKTGHPILIPGSNQDYSYILRPLPGAVASGFSVNHGAGRRLSRSEAKRILHQKDINEQYRDAGILVNADGNVPIDESGACYKSSAEVIAAVTGAGLATVEHKLWPLASLKASK